ncbi:hypothetical protein [Rhodanobacter aciditrophus]|uniref:hypothetical protein n=1 Tax=Rhodanobacter aciditrophus TaxID=1623218 RepID=UPI003CEBB570
MTQRRPPAPDRAGGSRQVPAVIGGHEEASRITQAILDFVSRIPDSTVDGTADPRAQARQIAARAAQRAALTAGTLALPPGPLGWLTLLPELVTIWKLQAQMVSDIAAAYGRHAELGREQMLYCLFRHTAAQAFRDLVVRMGDRLLFRRMSQTVVERIAKQLGVKLSRRALGEGASRWLPVIGALGVGAYAYYDTGQVAATAIELFDGGIERETGDTPTEPASPARRLVGAVRKAASRRRGTPPDKA